KNTVHLLEGVITAGHSPGELLDLPSRVQAGVVQGATRAQAAQGLGHTPPPSPAGPAVRTPGGVAPGDAAPPDRLSLFSAPPGPPGMGGRVGRSSPTRTSRWRGACRPAGVTSPPWK